MFRTKFKSWSPWGWTEESCRKQVLKHLKGGGKHKEHVPVGESRDEEYEQLVETMEVLEDIYEPPAPSSKCRKRHVDDEAYPKAGPPIVARPKALSIQSEMDHGIMNMGRMAFCT